MNNKTNEIKKFYGSIDEGDPALIISAAARKFNITHGYAEKIFYEPFIETYLAQKKRDRKVEKYG